MVLFPRVTKVLAETGENIKLVQLRRKLSAAKLAESANLSMVTLWHIEKGSPAVSIGAYIQVLSILGLEKDYLLVARDDIPGRKLQNIGLRTRKRAPKKISEEK